MAQNLDPLRTNFEQKPQWLAFAGTFAFASETTVEELKNCSKNENTTKSKSTRLWVTPKGPGQSAWLER